MARQTPVRTRWRGNAWRRRAASCAAGGSPRCAGSPRRLRVARNEGVHLGGPVRRLAVGAFIGSEADVKYVSFIWADGLPAPDELAAIQRELPGWVEEMDGRGVRLLGDRKSVV